MKNCSAVYKAQQENSIIHIGPNELLPGLQRFFKSGHRKDFLGRSGRIFDVALLRIK
jgi:hypothetical protein